MKCNFFVFALLSILISACGGNNFPEVPKKIMVTGSSEMEITPDEIYMNFTIQEYYNGTN